MSYFSPHCKELEVSVRRVEYFYFQLDANGKYYNLDFRRQVCVGRGVKNDKGIWRGQKCMHVCVMIQRDGLMV